MKPPVIDHNRALMSDRCIEYYQHVSQNPYIQQIMPGFRLTLAVDRKYKKSPTVDSLDKDRYLSEQLYGKSVASNVPGPDICIAGDCANSYGCNVLAMMFAFGHCIGMNYNESLTLDMTVVQALSIHQALFAAIYPILIDVYSRGASLDSIVKVDNT